MKFIDFFAGIGGFHSGLESAGYEMVGWVEWDKYARKSYETLYDTEGKYTANDIKSIKDGKELPEADLWAFGSPCTNISVAGSRVGLQGEQSSMFFEVIRLLKDRTWEEKPSYLLMENVKNLLGSNKGFDFFRVLYEMDEAGYDVEWEVFNSSWTIPQNRERVYIVGHKRGIAYTPVFPIYRESLEAKRKYNMLRDVLEQDVDEKFYLSKDKVEQLLVNDKKSTFSNGGDIKVVGNTSNTRYRSHDVVDSCGVSKTITASEGVKVNSLIGIGVLGNTSNTGHHTEDVLDEKGLSKTLTAASFKHPVQIATEVKQVGNISHSTSFGGNPQTGRVYDESGLSPTLNTMQGGGREPKVLVEPCLTPDRVNKRQNGRRFKNNDEPSFTLTAADRHGILLSNGKTYVIRKLTPLECWRLQGFTDEQFYKAKQAGVSNTQLYKQAGNAVTVPVVEAIAEKLSKAGGK
ncbi:DNA (cytosine-5-)-methyltransferase [Limosilactobacillus reuteri]|uniref:DNA (cytosine-5-)-methyltransferase n=1 Tax=Limosilactobacillus reuteri TaxID=1598 RepID=UPI003D08EF60